MPGAFLSLSALAHSFALKKTVVDLVEVVLGDCWGIGQDGGWGAAGAW